MLPNNEEIDLNQMVDEKIEMGNQLQNRFLPFMHIEGAIKIQKKISREIKYLEKVWPTLQCFLTSSNRISSSFYVCELGQKIWENSAQ